LQSWLLKFIRVGMKSHFKWNRLAGFGFFWIIFFSPLIHYGESNSTSLPEITKVGESLYQFGEVLIDRKAKVVSLPAVSNQVNGLIEYGVVHESGKIHESLFRTVVRPQIVHASLLLLKCKPAKGFFENLWAEKPREIDYSSHQVKITVSWELNGTKYENKIENLALNQKNDQAMSRDSIVFTGSKFIEGIFMAESSGSILAVYADETAIFNSTDHDSNNDDVWYANKLKMPPLECPVMIRFHLQREVNSPKLRK
jgi:hypothetical protein